MLLTAPQLAAVNSSDGLGNRRMEFIYIYTGLIVYRPLSAKFATGRNPATTYLSMDWP